jgi:hypothetical protein
MADEGIKRLIELGVNAGPAIAELQKLNAATQAQTESLDGLQKGLQSMVDGATKLFEGHAIKEGIEWFVNGVRQMIDEMDQLGKSAQTVGLSVEKLQEVQYALKLGAGLDSGEATAALTRFNDKLADLTNKTSDASRVMRDMGITVNDSVDEALAKMADRFANAPDGINKAAVATEIFGRNLAQKMIPFLNGGADGIADLIKELHQLGGTYDSDVAKQAGDFNDNLTKLAQHSKDLGVTITKDLLPPLVELSGKFVQAAKDGNLFDTAMQRYWQNVSDFWTKTGRAIGVTDSATNEEVRKTEQGFQDLAKTMDANRAAAARLASTEPLPDAHVEKIKKAGAAAKQAKSDFEQWMDSMLKIQTATDDSGAKIEWLTSHLAALAKSGDTTSEVFKKWNAELLKLRPDALATELLKLADAAKKLDEATSDKMLEGLEAQLATLEKDGPVATAQVKLLHDQILKIKADGGDALAIFTQDLEKLRIEAEKNNAVWAITEDQFAQGKITVQEYSEELSKHLGKMSTQTKQIKDDVFDLGKAISDASAKFVTDFVDNLIDGFGQVHKSFSETITDMLKQLAKLIIQQQVAASFKSIQAAGGLGALFNAQGAAFASPSVQYMAQGGILSSPTFFAHGGRLAVAGEAGPEAVVPLQRSSSGDLGVGASPVTVQVINNTPAQVSTSAKDQADGSRLIQITIQQAVKGMFNDGSMDRTMRTAYGVGRQPAAG